MKIGDYNKLKKCMQLTTSANDHEALGAIRAANKILADAGGITWERVFARVITVVNEVEEDPERNGAAHDVDVPDGMVAIDGHLVKPMHTDLAYRFSDGRTTEWVPKSKCTLSGDGKTMVMPEWMAKEKGFI